MTGRYKAYPEYKESGYDSLGLVPNHWVVCKLKHIKSEATNAFVDGPFGSNLKSEHFIDNGDVYVIESNFATTGKLDTKNLKTISNLHFNAICRSETKEGAIIIAKIGARYGMSSILPAINKKAVVSGNSLSLQINKSKMDLDFCHKILIHQKVEGAMDDGVNVTAQPALSLGQLNNLPFVNPPLIEQQKIANFLDHETAKIDTLIAKQEKLIELLKEKRQAVISHAVTKGLNPDAPMKDSGVEWLGEVPEHWGVSSLGYYANLNTGATPDRSNTSYWGGDIPWIKTGEVRYDTIYNTEESISPLAVKDTAVKISRPGTLLMAMYGQGVTRGRVAILGVPSAYNQACVAIEANKSMWNEFLKVFFIAAYHAIRDGGNETSQMNLNADIVSKFKVTIPPIIEQRDIVKHLESILPQFDTLVEKSEKAIKLIQERKTALISAAVTGKIDVRDWDEQGVQG